MKEPLSLGCGKGREQAGKVRPGVGLALRQIHWLAVVRSVMLAALILALARPVVERRGRWQSVVFAVDVSHSVSREALAGAVAWVSRAAQHPAIEQGTVVAFGQSPRLLGGVGEGLGMLQDASGVAGISPDATDIERALDLALTSTVPGTAPRIVLLSDGRPTAGSLRRAVAHAQARGIPIDTRPMTPRETSDIWLDTATVPPIVRAGERFTVAVRVGSQRAADVEVNVRQGSHVLASRRAPVAPGLTTVSLDLDVDDRGLQPLDIDILVDGDADPANNTRREALAVLPRARVLYAEGRPASARYLAGALRGGGFTVDVVSAPLAVSPERLRAYDLVVLSDLPRAAIGNDAMVALAAYVRDGGGLVFVGGESVYGEDGYSNSELESILPVSFTLRKRPREFAMVLVLDRSWSMRGQKIELAREAARAAVEVLTAEQEIGIVMFNDSFDWVVKLQRASAREAIRQQIATIAPSGHTIIYPAIEQAFLALLESKAKVKHVILMSDGQSYQADYEALVKRMVEARMTVSTVAVGAEADRDLLKNIAAWGKGRAYVIEDAREVPQVFVKETERAAKPTLVEEPFRPIEKKRIDALRGVDLSSAPDLLGFTAAQAKPLAEVVLASPVAHGDDEQPILARWQQGLGRVVVFTSDVKDRWAAGWVRWPGYGQFWAQVARTTMRRRDLAAEGLDVRQQDDEVRVRLRMARPLAGEAPALEIVGPDRSERTVPMIGRGDLGYEAVLRPSAPDTYRVRAIGVGAVPPELFARVFQVEDTTMERPRPPDEDLLRAISGDTGGRFDPSADDFGAIPVGPVRRRTEAWPWLAGLALVAYLVDLFLRRVRLFKLATGEAAWPERPATSRVA